VHFASTKFHFRLNNNGIAFHKQVFALTNIAASENFWGGKEEFMIPVIFEEFVARVPCWRSAGLRRAYISLCHGARSSSHFSKARPG